MLDWTRLKSYQTSPATSFEELCYQIARVKYGTQGRLFSGDDSGGGDGVEFILDRFDGTEWGWQAKFYPHARLTSQRRKAIEDSLKTSVDNHRSRLRRWFLCAPLNLAVKGKNSEMAWFREVLPTLAPGVELEFWGASEIAAMLQDPGMDGVRRFFFGDLVLSPQWFADRFKEQRANIGERYDPELHTETDVEAALHALCGDDAFQALLAQVTAEIDDVLLALDDPAAPALETWGAPLVGPGSSGAPLAHTSQIDPTQAGEAASAVRTVADAAVRLRETLRRVAAELAVGHVFESPQLVAAAEAACEDLRKVLAACTASVAGAGDSFTPSLLRRLDRAMQSGFEVRRLRHPDLHVFGEPGIGKSHLCCNVLHTSLRQNRPALLFLGSTFSRDYDLQLQIRDQAGLPATYGWDEFLDSLNTCAAVYRTRALIVLDGLNETEPGVWRERLPGLVASVARFPRIALVTTSRELYREQVWAPGEPTHAVQADGFALAAVETAMQKYLAYFGLRANFDGGSLEAFRRPIYLSLFCRLYRSEDGAEREIALETQTLYAIFDAYLSHTETLIRKHLDRGARPVLRHKLIELADRLWETRWRALSLDEVCTRLDGAPGARLEWRRSYTFAVLDAALLLRRLPPSEMGDEWVEFSYDLFAGYLIAEALLRGRPPEDVETLIRSAAFAEALASDDFEKRHPLHEDIFRALIVARPELVGIRAEPVAAPRTDDDPTQRTPELAEQDQSVETAEHRPVTSRFTIDLNEGVRVPMVIFRQHLRLKNRFWFPWLPFRKSLDVPYHRIWVEADVPNTIRVRDSENLVVLEAPHLQTHAAELRDFRIQAEEFPFDVVLNGGAILDVTDGDVSHIDIEVRVGFQPRPNAAPMMEALTVRLDLVRALPHPRYFVVVEPAFETGYEHRREPAALLGTLYIENATPGRYAEPLDCTVFLPSENTPLPSLLTFGPPLPADHAGHAEVQRGGALLVRGLAPQARIAVPLLLDLTRVPNPTALEEFSSLIMVESHVGGRAVQHQPYAVRYRVAPNRSIAALFVTLVEAGSFRPIDPGTVLFLDEAATWYPGRRAGLLECFTVRIGNTAKRGSGRVRVRKLSLEFDPSASIGWKDGASFRINRRFSAELPRELDLPNADESHQDFVVSFRHDEITDLSGDRARFRCRVVFEYREIGDDTPTAWRHFEAAINGEIERDAGPGWLAIDFGTAAIAVAAPDAEGNVRLVDLQQSLRQWIDPRDYTPEQVPEFATPFVSSSIRLLPTHCLDAPNRERSIVELAPLRRDLVNARFPLPHVKALIGTYSIPDLTGRLKEFVYRATDGAELRVAAEHPISTEALLRETYARLLTDFVAPVLGERWPGKAVVSIPNGFTPRHAEHLRALLVSRFPLRREYVTFISESDAVVCFYIANWEVLNHRRNPSERDALRSDDEYVLIYDMGAGTLDLTYARIQSSGGSRREVTVLGHMGSSAAGDYLDYVLARQIHEQHAELFLHPMFGPTTDPATLAARLWLKRVVQEQVKPALNGSGTVTLRRDEGYLTHDVAIDLRTLRSSPPVTQFLRASTTGVMENLFALSQWPGHPHRRGTLPLHTVVLSGRGTQLRLLRDAVALELQEWSGNEFLYLVDDLTAVARKSAVVIGATLFAEFYRRQTSNAPLRFSRRNLLARYGLLYRDPRKPDMWVFAELLNPSTMPVSLEATIQHGMMIYSYDTDVHDADANDRGPNAVDLTQTAQAYFVQSFAVDTAADANAGRWEYITRMAGFEVESVSPGRRDRVPVRITVDEENQMTFRLGHQMNDPVAPLRMNVADSPMFRGGMWPLSFGPDD